MKETVVDPEKLIEWVPYFLNNFVTDWRDDFIRAEFFLDEGGEQVRVFLERHPPGYVFSRKDSRWDTRPTGDSIGLAYDPENPSRAPS